MFAFLKRLVGQDDEALEAERRFKRGLHSMGVRQRELSLAGVDIDNIVNSVDRKQMEIELSRTLSSISGEHRLGVPSIPDSEGPPDERKQAQER